MSLKPRLLAMAGAVLAATAVMTGGAGAAVSRTDVITFTSHAILTPPGSPDHFSLVSDSCSARSGGGPASPCVTAGSGTVSATGGVARAVVASAGGIIILDETYVFTGPTTSYGSGSATRIDARTGARQTGTFSGNFTTAPTGDPNVLLDSGTITVTY